MNQASETHLVRTPVAAPQKASVTPPVIPPGNSSETCFVGAMPAGAPRPAAVPAANNGSETCFVGAMPAGAPRPAAVPAANNGSETCFVGAMPAGAPRPAAIPAANNGGETQFVGALPVGTPHPAAVPAANNGGETQFVGALPVGASRPAANNGGETQFVGALPVGAPHPAAVPAANNGGETQFVGALPVGAPRPAAITSANNGGETQFVGTLPVGASRPAANNGGETQFVGAASSIPAVPAAATQPEAFQPTDTQHNREQVIPQAPKQGSTAIPSAAAAPVSTAPLPNGTLLDSNRYEILGFMGQGGFGITYKARHKRMGRECVIKESFPKAFVGRAEDGHTVVLKDTAYGDLVSSINESFLNEALNIVELIKGHDGGYPNLINAIDAFEANGTAYYVMDYIHGKPLTKLIDDKTFFEDWTEGQLNLKLESKLELLLLQVLEGLEIVHNKNITHLDIKPDNIMIKSDGNPVLIDFGASRSTANKQDNQLQFASFGYAPPEQREQGHEHEIGACSDIYALGATFYHLLTGKCPEAKSVPQPLQQMDAAQVHGVSRAFRAAIDRAMQQAPGSRWKSATEWKELLLAMQKAKADAIKLHEGR